MIFIDYYMNMDYYNDCWGGDMWITTLIYMIVDYYNDMTPGTT